MSRHSSCGTLYVLAEKLLSILTALVPLVWLAWLLTLPARPPAWLVFSTGLAVVLVISRRQQRGWPGGWRAFVRETADVHLLALVLLCALAVQFEDTHGITTDGVVYFSQLRSVVFDRDLDVAAEFAYLGQPERPTYIVPIGPTVVWFPLYLVVAAVDALGRAFALWAAPPEPVALGLTLPYVRAVLVSSFAIGTIGLLVLHARLRREFGAVPATLATLLVFAATPLVWYMVYEPSMTHAASFGFVALFVTAAERWTRVDVTPRLAAALGVLLGLAFVTRPQEAVFAIFPAMILATLPLPARDRLRAVWRMTAWGLAGCAPFLLLQVAHSAILLSREPYDLVTGSNAYLDFTRSRWADTLWSSWHGFFAWTPTAYIAALAMLFYARRHRAWALAALVIVLVMAWVNGSTADWAAGWSFGGRRFTSVLVVLAPGLALIVHALLRRPMAALALTAAALVLWNQWLVAQYTQGLLTRGAPATFDQVVRQQAALATSPPFVYPFAFPANVWFAWRTGLAVEDYDLLGAEPLGPAFELEMTREAARYLTIGWGAHVSDPFGELRWIDGDRAELLLPLDLPAAQPVRVAWTARTRRLDPVDLVTFALVINGRETFRFTPDTDQASFFEFTVPPGSDLFIRGFNRIAFQREQGMAPLGVYRVGVQGGTKNEGLRTKN